MTKKFTVIQGTRSVALASALLLGALAVLPFAYAQYPTASQIGKNGMAVQIEDYASLPISGRVVDKYPATVNYQDQLGRVNSLRSEPANAPMASSRFFVNDSNSVLYILDKSTKKFTPYIDFGAIFPKFTAGPSHAFGLVSFQFDPGYAKNGKFYTVHIENPAKPGDATPTNVRMPSLNLTGYATTPVVNPPAGPVHFESVLIEWTDTNIRNATFEGTARELLRVGFDRNHPMDDLLFNPLAKPGQPDYGNLYISIGDGAQGETPGPGHAIPQRLDTLLGKILRITPDVNLRPKDELSADGRYRIPSTGPDPNPFVSVTNARGEIYAYGLRHPHRMTWDVPTNTFLVNDIGLHSWEEVNIVSKGANYGYAEREGNEQVFVGGPNNGKTGGQTSPPTPFPQRDLLTVEGLIEPVVPVYPVAVYSHYEGDSIGSGFVYRGKLMPALRGKYIFNDMTTGRIFYSDLNEMIAAKGKRNQQAKIHELQIVYKGPDNSGPAADKRMYDIIADAYAHKGGKANPNSDQGVLPGISMNTGGWAGQNFVPGKTDPYGIPYGGGRADDRVALGGDGEIYILSKSDGMIRKFTAVAATPSGAGKAGGN